MANTEPFVFKSPRVWSIFVDAMGKAIFRSQFALGPFNFPLLS